MQNAELASSETIQRFNTDFDTNYATVASGTRCGITKYLGSFQKMCVKSREQKKPILLLITRTNSRDCFKQALEGLAQADAVQEMVEEGFIFTGFTIDRPPLVQLENFINLSSSAQAALYFVVVSYEAKVQFLRRQQIFRNSTADEIADKIFTFVQECQNLYSIMLEEDPGY